MLSRQKTYLQIFRPRQSYGSVIFWKFARHSSTIDIKDSQDDKKKSSIKEWRREPTIWRSAFKSLASDAYQPSTNYLLLMRTLSLNPDDIQRWIKKKAYISERLDQEFNEWRHKTLGCDLAAAHFFVHRGAKVKFHGHSEWIQRVDDRYDLPNKYDESYYLEALDASGMVLYYEGIENLCDLYKLKWARFKGSPKIDDWCLDKMSVVIPQVEYLDVSECPLVTERGLEALYRMYNLKTLVVTNFNKSAALELACLMLEDCSDGLKCEIREPENKSEAKELPLVN